MGIGIGLIGIGSTILGSVGVGAGFLAGTVGTVLSGAIGGALVGAAIGGLTSAVTGGDIGKGILFGATGGAVGGGVAGWSAGAGGAVQTTVQYGVSTTESLGAVSQMAPLAEAAGGSAAILGEIGSTEMIAASFIKEGITGYLESEAAGAAQEAAKETAERQQEMALERMEREAELAREMPRGGGFDPASMRRVELEERKWETERADIQKAAEARGEQFRGIGGRTRRAALEAGTVAGPAEVGIQETLQERHGTPIIEPTAVLAPVEEEKPRV